MRCKIFLAVLVLFLFGFSAVGCSKDLSREKASSMIKETLKTKPLTDEFCRMANKEEYYDPSNRAKQMTPSLRASKFMELGKEGLIIYPHRNTLSNHLLGRKVMVRRF